MPHTIAEIDEELRRISAGWANPASRATVSAQLENMLTELWGMPGSDARDLRCRVRRFIDEGKVQRSA